MQMSVMNKESIDQIWRGWIICTCLWYSKLNSRGETKNLNVLFENPHIVEFLCLLDLSNLYLFKLLFFHGSGIFVIIETIINSSRVAVVSTWAPCYHLYNFKFFMFAFNIWTFLSYWIITSVVFSIFTFGHNFKLRTSQGQPKMQYLC